MVDSQKSKIIEFLEANDNEKLKEYIKGNANGKEYATHLNVPKEVFYKTMLDMDIDILGDHFKSYDNKELNKKIDQLVMVLEKDKRNIINSYINRYFGVSDYANALNISRQKFYYALKLVEPDYKEKREKIKQDILQSISRQIKRCIPVEYLEFDEEKLYGKTSKYHIETKTKKMMYIKKSLFRSDYKEDLQEFTFISLDTFNLWYKRYCVILELLKNDKKVSEIASMYDMELSRIYPIRKYINNHNGKLLPQVSMKQERIYIENINIYNEFLKGTTISNIENNYKIDESIISTIIKLVEQAEMYTHNTIKGE